jgi:hypothetical protein
MDENIDLQSIANGTVTNNGLIFSNWILISNGKQYNLCNYFNIDISLISNPNLNSVQNCKRKGSNDDWFSFWNRFAIGFFNNRHE